jgi:hypothetical protein
MSSLSEMHKRLTIVTGLLIFALFTGTVGFLDSMISRPLKTKITINKMPLSNK